MAAGVTLRGGRLLAQYGIRYVIVPLADGAHGTVGTPLPTPSGLVDVLEDQLDLAAPLTRPPNYLIYENSAYTPTRSVLSEEGAAASQEAGGEAMAGADLRGSVPFGVGGPDIGDFTGDVTAGTLHVAVPYDSNWSLTRRRHEGAGPACLRLDARVRRAHRRSRHPVVQHAAVAFAVAGRAAADLAGARAWLQAASPWRVCVGAVGRSPAWSTPRRSPTSPRRWCVADGDELPWATGAGEPVMSRRLLAILVGGGAAGRCCWSRPPAASRPPATVPTFAALGSPSMPFVPHQGFINSTWFCPGVPTGGTGLGGSVTVANPSDAPLSGQLTVFNDVAGTEPVEQRFEVPARDTFVVDLATVQSAGTYLSAMVEITGGGGLRRAAGRPPRRQRRQPVLQQHLGQLVLRRQLHAG